MVKILHGHHTTNDPCKGPVPCRMCGVTLTSEDHWASDEEDWFYCEQCWRNIEAKELLHPTKYINVTGLRCQTCDHDKGEHVGDNFVCVSCSCMQFVDPRQPSNWVDHPSHYNSHPSGVECIQIVEWMSFNVGNAIKYLWRADEKGNPLEDLEKAAWYINREIERRKHGS